MEPTIRGSFLSTYLGTPEIDFELPLVDDLMIIVFEYTVNNNENPVVRYPLSWTRITLKLSIKEISRSNFDALNNLFDFLLVGATNAAITQNLDDMPGRFQSFIDQFQRLLLPTQSDTKTTAATAATTAAHINTSLASSASTTDSLDSSTKLATCAAAVDQSTVLDSCIRMSARFNTFKALKVQIINFLEEITSLRFLLEDPKCPPLPGFLSDSSGQYPPQTLVRIGEPIFDQVEQPQVIDKAHLVCRHAMDLLESRLSDSEYTFNQQAIIKIIEPGSHRDVDIVAKGLFKHYFDNQMPDRAYDYMLSLRDGMDGLSKIECQVNLIKFHLDNGNIQFALELMDMQPQPPPPTQNELARASSALQRAKIIYPEKPFQSKEQYSIGVYVAIAAEGSRIEKENADIDRAFRQIKESVSIYDNGVLKFPILCKEFILLWGTLKINQRGDTRSIGLITQFDRCVDGKHIKSIFNLIMSMPDNFDKLEALKSTLPYIQERCNVAKRRAFGDRNIDHAYFKMMRDQWELAINLTQKSIANYTKLCELYIERNEIDPLIKLVKLFLGDNATVAARNEFVKGLEQFPKLPQELKDLILDFNKTHQKSNF